MIEHTGIGIIFKQQELILSYGKEGGNQIGSYLQMNKNIGKFNLGHPFNTACIQIYPFLVKIDGIISGNKNNSINYKRDTMDEVFGF